MKKILILICLAILACTNTEEQKEVGYYGAFETGTYLALGDGHERDKILAQEQWSEKDYVENVFDHYAPYYLDLTKLRQSHFTKKEALGFLKEGYRIGICINDYCKPVRREYNWVNGADLLYITIPVYRY